MPAITAITLLPMICQAFLTASCGILISRTLQRFTEQTSISFENQTTGLDTHEQQECTFISETLIITTSLPFLPFPKNHLSHRSGTIIEIPSHGLQSEWTQGQIHQLLLGNTLSATYIETYLQQLVYQVSPFYGHDLNRVRHCIHKALEDTLQQYPQEAECLSEPSSVSKMNMPNQSPLFIPKIHKPTLDQLIFPTRDLAYPTFTMGSLDRPM